MKLGIELEASYPGNPWSTEADNKNDSLAKELMKKCKSVLEGEGRDGGGVEVKCKPMTFEEIEKGKKQNKFKFLDIFRKNMYVANNDQAGMHIHVDRDVFTFDQFEQLLEFLRNTQLFMIEFSERKHRKAYA